MSTSPPDIIVVSPDGECLIVVEVKSNGHSPHRQSVIEQAIEQVKGQMVSMDCSTGLAVIGDHVILLRDSLEKAKGESISVVGEASLSDHLLPAADDQWRGQRGLEFESRVQRWLEQIKQMPTLDPLPNDLKALLDGRITNLLRLGDVRAAGPRWRRVAH